MRTLPNTILFYNVEDFKGLSTYFFVLFFVIFVYHILTESKDEIFSQFFEQLDHIGWFLYKMTLIFSKF